MLPILAVVAWKIDRHVTLALAVIAILTFATLFTQAGRLAPLLACFRGQTVSVRIWGTNLPRLEGSLSKLEFVSAAALGAALEIHLKPMPAGEVHRLKIYAPKQAELGDDWALIREAKYVQWFGQTLKATNESEPAFSMHVIEPYRLPTDKKAARKGAASSSRLKR